MAEPIEMSDEGITYAKFLDYFKRDTAERQFRTLLILGVMKKSEVDIKMVAELIEGRKDND